MVGDRDVEAQVDQVAGNALTALAAVWRRFGRSAIASAFTSASTLLGVAQLGFPDQLVELDLTPVVPD